MDRSDQVLPEEVWRQIDAGSPPVLLDVREPWEYALAHLPDSILIPLQSLPHRFSELPRDREIVVLCHHGVRSMTAITFLQKQGFTQLKNLAGGIDLYSRIDPTIPRYR